MMAQLNDLRARMAGLSDDELLVAVTRESEDYTEEALTVAREEIRQRGGLEKLRNQRAEKDSILKQTRARIDDVKSAYGFPAHVSATIYRWRYYGLILVAWLIFRYVSRRGGSSPAETAEMLGLEIGLLIVLAALYSVAYSTVTYRKTLDKLVAVRCRKCGKPTAYYTDRIKVKVDERRLYESHCSRCGASTQIDLGFAFDATPEQGVDACMKDDGSLMTLGAVHYLGPFKRRQWTIALFPQEVVFQSRQDPKNRVVIPKSEARNRVAFLPGEVNLRVRSEGSELKFILLDATPLVDWLPEQE